MLMTPKNIFHLLISLFLFSAVAPAQEATELWYAFSMQGEVNSCEVFEDKMVFKAPMDTESDKGVSVVTIEKQLDQGLFIVKNEKKREPYALVSILKEDGLLKMGSAISGSSVEEVETLYQNNGAPTWGSLREQHWYSEEKIAEIQKAPGLDELKREDLLQAMQWREPLSEKLQQYLEDTKGERYHMVYRFIENYRNQRLVALGYNPYKQVVYNLYKQFEGDKEIMDLLNEEVKF